MPIPLAGAKIKAADLAAIFPQNVDAWTDYTPILAQSATVTKTVEYARFTKVGRLTAVQLSLSVTGTGTAGNAVRIGMPANTPNFRGIGVGAIFDSSASLWYQGIALWDTDSVFRIQASGVANALGISAFTAALASGDVITADLLFMAS